MFTDKEVASVTQSLHDDPALRQLLLGTVFQVAGKGDLILEYGAPIGAPLSASIAEVGCAVITHGFTENYSKTYSEEALAHAYEVVASSDTLSAAPSLGVFSRMLQEMVDSVAPEGTLVLSFDRSQARARASTTIIRATLRRWFENVSNYFDDGTRVIFLASNRKFI